MASMNDAHDELEELSQNPVKGLTQRYSVCVCVRVCFQSNRHCGLYAANFECSAVAMRFR